ncbi:MAG: hypothetical protein COV34_01775 [Candidatus Zambryskibacteria bacterium CG10_big_fil_rev_8_21_14_0_10_42_12]|uniref:DUF11 domain-containing protein n=1 Tax=Candidatus Zambryskibacteria bacterium CG10_big_fil_rev_8_21_14_0_10_42_12 TaxID=1975115 RepID=A0A2H0QWH1_9BACT|nr:MAG: hypothetical protein COV34_01775 [Candidatus Zambryskibacteria bacterium CG10_big_fil_rev_8_21_14_0_10_42_12]
MTYKKILISIGAATALIAGPLFVLADHSTTTVVSPDNMNDWWFYEEIAEGNGSFELGPLTAPAGEGSAHMSVDDTGRLLLGTFSFQGIRLDTIETLAYNSYRATGTAALAPSLQLDIDTDTTDATTTWQGRLVYEPYFTNTVNTGEWQTWNTLDNAPDGNWWFSGAPGDATCPQSNPCTWTEVLTAFPNAGVRNAGTTTGAIQFKAGGPWAGGFEGNVDNFIIEIDEHTNIFDFEPSETMIEPVGAITAPTENQHVTGTTTLSATYDDGDDINDDAVQWAVRAGTCVAATTTVFGNVDGKSDVFSWNGASFSATIDTSTTTPGTYCFIFNPTDDAGQPDLRLTREFNIDETVVEEDNNIDLAISKTATNTVEIDHKFTYTIIVTNNGPEEATDVVVTDVLPSGLEFKSASSTKGTYTASTSKWIVGTLADDESATLHIRVLANATGTIINTATADSSDDDTDTNLSNNSDSHTTTVEDDENGDDDDDDNDDHGDEPEDKDDCKKGGWQNYPDLGFKNQGQCVSYVASGKTSYYARYNANRFDRLDDAFDFIKKIKKLNDDNDGDEEDDD